MPETAEGGAHGDAAATTKPGFSLGRRTAIVLISMNIMLAASLAYVVLQNAQLQAAHTPKFDLLSANVAWMDVDSFLQKQKTMTVSYAPMKQSLADYVDGHGLRGRYSIYFEDLTTGAWVGIDEKDKFMPASLLKMPTLIAILKKVELGGMSLDDNVTLTKGMLDFESGTLAYKDAGYSTSVRELLNYMIRESDNTALWALNSRLTIREYTEVWNAVGLPVPSSVANATVSPKEYANILRALYLSTYLRRTFSQLALSMLAETEYDAQLQGGVPAGVNVAHKVGYYQEGGYYHDCGIVYVPEKPYILCVMSKDSTLLEANTAISGVSSIVYGYVTSGQATS
jgi:beta-lactamase class A